MHLTLKGMIFPSLLLLAACGTNSNDRVQGGAAAGAATGAGIGLIGGPIGVLAGGLIGGGAGAITGATVPARDMNMGAPPWSGKSDAGQSDNSTDRQSDK